MIKRIDELDMPSGADIHVRKAMSPNKNKTFRPKAHIAKDNVKRQLASVKASDAKLFHNNVERSVYKVIPTRITLKM